MIALVRVFDPMAPEIRDIVLWGIRGLEVVALIAIVFWAPAIWESVQDRRHYGEPLEVGTVFRFCGCILAAVIIWQAHPF